MFNVGDIVVLTPEAKERFLWWYWKDHEHRVISHSTWYEGECNIQSLVDHHNSRLRYGWLQLTSPAKIYSYEELL